MNQNITWKKSEVTNLCLISNTLLHKQKMGSSFFCKLPLLLPTLFLLSTVSFAESSNFASLDSPKAPENRTSVAEYFLYGLTSLYSAVYLHELGHAYTAKTYGAKDIKISIGLTGGETTFPTDGMSSAELRNVYLAGPITNRLVAGATNQILNFSDSQGTPTRWGAMFYFANRYIVLHNWLTGIISWTDFSKAARTYSEEYSVRARVMAGYGVILGLDLWLCWDDILRNRDRLIYGRTEEQKGSEVGFVFYDRVLALNYKLSF